MNSFLITIVIILMLGAYMLLTYSASELAARQH